ncbi:MAG: PP2C family protein-serine/threonine phosphatase [Acidobacteriia bacterium]|nr:PP2C family protein-serine/threonine phosphatase [Terriglobia bacterium]
MELKLSDVDLLTLQSRREQELEEARIIQQGMFPPESLVIGSVTMAHKVVPMTEVGGDFLDYFALSDATLGLYLGDVAGKGLPAALYAALAVGTLRGVQKTGACPTTVLELLNRRLAMRGIPARYAATQYALYDPATRRLHVSNGGVPGPLHLTARGCRELLLPGIPPGLLMEAGYEVKTLQLETGDSVVFFTDGITDAMNHRDELYGIERLVRLCEEHRGARPAELLERIFSEVGEFVEGQQQRDDMTVAILHCGE